MTKTLNNLKNRLLGEKIMKLSERIFARCFNNVKSFPRLFVGIIFLVLMTVTMGYSQSTFNDMWADDSNVDENGNGLVVVGRGVSEINYVDEDGVEVETRITSPSGRTVMSGAFGEVSAQSDARLAFDWEDIGDFTVRVERFPMCNNGYYEGGDYFARRQVYGGQPAPAGGFAARHQRPRGFEH